MTTTSLDDADPEYKMHNFRARTTATSRVIARPLCCCPAENLTMAGKGDDQREAEFALPLRACWACSSGCSWTRSF